MNAGQPAEQQARLIAMPSRGCSSAQAKERFIFFLIMWAPRRGAVLHEVRPYGGEEPLVVSMSSIMSVMSRESREYIFRGGVGEVMTHYVGRSVEGDEGVVVADGMSVERLVCGGGDGGVGDHVVVVVEEPDAVSGERHTSVGP